MRTPLEVHESASVIAVLGNVHGSKQLENDFKKKDFYPKVVLLSLMQTRYFQQ